MYMYYLCENVYIVNGAINAAIYDFNNNLLYQVSEKPKELLNKCLSGEKSFTSFEKKGINNLLEKNIITPNYVPSHNIKDIKKENETIFFSWIEITTMCNCKCIHCYEEASIESGKIMEYKDFCYAIDELQNYGVKKIQLIGGEPCILGNNILKYLDYAIGKFDDIAIYSNGTIMTDEMISYFKKNNVRVLLSVYSYNPSWHDSVTQVIGSHSKTVNTIKKLKLAGIKYRTNNILMKNICLGNKDTELYNLSTNGDIVRLTGRANVSLLNPALMKKKMITRKSFKKPINRELTAKLLKWNRCFSNRIYIACNLDVYPCVMERRILHGNLKYKKLEEIIRDDIKMLNKDYIDECSECELRYACLECRPDSLGGKITAKPWQCTYLPLKGLWQDSEELISSILDNDN